MHIAILGTRGIPARYGGFETFAEEVASGLVDRGHTVTVYARRGLYPEASAEYRGVRIRYIRNTEGKVLGTLTHDVLSLIDVGRLCPDVVYMLGYRSAWALGWARRGSAVIVVNTDGLEWRRRKWGFFARQYLKWCEGQAVKRANALVSDSRIIAHWFWLRYGATSRFIPNGARDATETNMQVLRDHGVRAGEYATVVCRMEPENNVDIIVREWSQAGVELPLLVIGGSNHQGRFHRSLRTRASDKIRFLGPIYERSAINTLRLNAMLHIHGHEVGGTNPTLVETMRYGVPVLAIDVPFNREVLGPTGQFFQTATGRLARCIETVVRDASLRARMATEGRRRACQEYDWGTIVDEHERLFAEVSELGVRDQCDTLAPR